MLKATSLVYSQKKLIEIFLFSDLAMSFCS